MELERAFQNVSDLFALVMVLRHHRALGQENLGNHGFFAANDLAPDGGAENFLLHFVPGVVFHVQPLYNAYNEETSRVIVMSRRFLLSLFLIAGGLCAADSHVWKVAGPPPESWQRDRVTDLASRRKAAMEQLGNKAILILYAAEPRNYAGDVDWPYRQENDFFYLTGITQEGSTLVLIPGADRIREILFMPPSNPAKETWTGHILTADEGRSISGIPDVWDARNLSSFLTTLIPQTAEMLAGPAGRGARTDAQQPPPIPVDVTKEFAKTIKRRGRQVRGALHARRPKP